MGLPRSERARGRRTEVVGSAGDSDKKPKKKLDATAVWREARALIVARWGRIAVGLVLMLINRLAGLVLPASSKYLIDDVARRHGGIRIGTAAGYLRSDDEALLATIMADRRCGELRLRRLAPTVLISNVNAAALVATLREAGYPAAAEDDQGALVVRAPRQQRTIRRVRRATPDSPFSSMTAERVSEAIARLREGEQRRRVLQRLHRLGDEHNRTIATDTDEMVRVISQVITEKGELWLGFIDPHGAMTRRLVRPLSISAGFLRAEDERTETSHTFALHRITSVALPEYQ